MVKDKLTKNQKQLQYDLLITLQSYITNIRKLLHRHDISKMPHMKRKCAERIDDALCNLKEGIAKAKTIKILPDNKEVLEEIERKYSFFERQNKRL